MNSFFRSPKISLIVGASLLACGATAQAQTANAPVVRRPALTTLAILVRNVDPALLAYWFDAAHQPTPMLIQNSLSYGGGWDRYFRGIPWEPGNANGPNGLTLPQGVVALSARSESGRLIATGTAEGLAALKKRVTELDVPLRFVETEMQIIVIKPADLDALKISFSATDPEARAPGGDVKIGFLPSPPFPPASARTMAGFSRGNFVQKLNELLATNKAKLITAPRIQVADGLTAGIQSSEMRSLILQQVNPSLTSAPTENGKQSELLQQMAQIATIRSVTGLKAALTIRDGSIAMDAQIILNNQTTQVSATFNEGQTLAVQLPPANANSDKLTVALITPRIVDRVNS